MISIKTYKEKVGNNVFNNMMCEHCSSKEDVYQVEINPIYNSRLVRVYLCKKCLQDLKKQIENIE